MKDMLFDIPEHLSPALIARLADDAAFEKFKAEKRIYTYCCDGLGCEEWMEWSAWYGVESPADFCDNQKTPDGIDCPQRYQDDCLGYGRTEKDAVADLIATWPHLGHWRETSKKEFV